MLALELHFLFFILIKSMAIKILKYHYSEVALTMIFLLLNFFRR
jgi:hypothetical protein